MATIRKPQYPVKFSLGDQVRVKRGVRDVGYPDMPLGGWAGTVIEVRGSDTFSIQWNSETLAAIHPVFIQRCKSDGIDPEEYTLTGDDLEPDPGGPLAIEQPTKIKTRPLSPKDEKDRIRMVFGLTSNDPLPDVDEESLKTYHRHLSKKLALPFRAEHGSEHGHPENIKVFDMVDIDSKPMIDCQYGILCRVSSGGESFNLPLAELEYPSRNRQLLRDYCYWFWDHR